MSITSFSLQDGESPAVRWKRLLIIYMLFVFLPLTILWLLSDNLFSRVEEVEFQKLSRKMRNDFIRILSWTDVSTRIGYQLKKLTTLFQKKNLEPEKFLERKKRIEESWGFSFDAYFWGPAGNLETPANFICRARNAITKFWWFLRSGNRDRVNENLSLIKNLFGEGWPASEAARGVPWKFQGIGNAGCLFWDIDPYSEFGGSLLIAWDVPPPDELLKNRIRTSRNFPYTVLFRNKNGDFRSLHSKGPVSEEMEIPAQFQLQQTPWIIDHQNLWMTMNIEGDNYYLGLPIKEERSLPWNQAIHLLIGGSALLMLFLIYRWMILGREIALSIRLKLMFLFSYAMALPLMGLLVLGVRAYQDYYSGMIEETRQTGLELMKTADDGFQRESQVMGRKFGRLKKLLDDPVRLRDFKKIAYYGKKRGWFGGIELQDVYARPCMRFGDILLQDSLMGKVMEELSVSAILQYLPERAPPGLEKPRQGMESFFIKSLIESKDVGFSKILTLPRFVHRILLPKKDVHFYWDYFQLKNHPFALFIGGQLTRHTKEKYLRRILTTQKQLIRKGYRLLIVNADGTSWFPFEYSRNKNFRLFSRHIFLTQERILEKAFWKGSSWIVSGMPGRLIPEYTYMVLYPESLIETRLNRFARLAGLGTVFAVIITLLLGWTLADTFLVPIAELGLGIAALKEQKLNYRLPHLGLDEFGDLSRAFNEMMENMKEMSAGKLVQEQLFPKTTLEAGCFTVRGLSRPATNLGGDYFDYGMVGTNNFFVLIGDVAGHGIPAALIMAMARATVTSFIRQGDCTPEKLLEELQQTIYSSMHGKRFMTSALLWGTCSTREVQYFNCGHPYMLLVKNGKRSEYLIQKGGTPIGTTRFAIKPPQILKLEAGDRLVLYSDGLVESLPEGNGSDSFDVFQKYVQDHPRANIEQDCTSILENHPFYKSGEPQPDDFTVVFLDRN